MKTHLTTTILILCSLSFTRAQSSQVGLTIGIGLPIDDFADSDADNSDSGLAQAGFQLEGLVDYGFSENLGLSGSLLYGRNSIDEDVLDDYAGAGTGIETDSYSQFGFFAGLLAQFPSAGLTFKMRFMPGVIFSKSYGLEASALGVVLDVDQVNATSLGIKIGGGLDIPITDQLNFVGNIDFVTYKAKYEGDFDTNLGVIFNNQEWEQPTSIIGIKVGAAVRL